MQGIMETIFDIAYLGSIITIGIFMLKGVKKIVKTNTSVKMPEKEFQFQLFAFMALILGFGDAFHLIPRSYSLLTDGLAAHATALGFGKLVTSITMTIFYVLLYRIWRLRYGIKNKASLSLTIYALALIRIVLCLFPQNDWFNPNAPVSWGIYRNLPFLLMGIIIIFLFWDQAKKHQDRVFGFAWLAITLSFLFYIPVVLWADIYPLIGILMIPKTLAYVWLILMGFKDFRQWRVSNPS